LYIYLQPPSAPPSDRCFSPLVEAGHGPLPGSTHVDGGATCFIRLCLRGQSRSALSIVGTMVPRYPLDLISASVLRCVFKTAFPGFSAPFLVSRFSQYDIFPTCSDFNTPLTDHVLTPLPGSPRIYLHSGRVCQRIGWTSSSGAINTSHRPIPIYGITRIYSFSHDLSDRMNWDSPRGHM
jgi:hypothetical protein